MQEPYTISAFLQNRFFLLSIAVLCFVSAFFISGKENADYSSATAHFEKVLNKKIEHSEKELSALSEKTKKWSYKELFSEKPGYYESLFDREGLVFFIFENDTLSFWTDNTIAVDNRLSQNNFIENIVKLPNGWFEIVKLKEGKKELLALVLLKREYAYQNRYLANEFQKEFNVSNDVDIKIENLKAKNRLGCVVHSMDGRYLFTLLFPAANSGNTISFYLALILNILGLFFAVCFLHVSCSSGSGTTGKKWGPVWLVGAVIALRYLCIAAHFPQVFYETKLFSPELYGDANYALLGSLGELLINVLIIFYLTYYIGRHINTGVLRLPGLFILLSLLFFASRILNYVFYGVINNSNIPFALNDIFNQNIYTYLCLVIISLLFLSYFICIDKVAQLIKDSEQDKGVLIIVGAAAIILFIVASHLLGTLDMILVCWPLLIFLIVMWIKQQGSSYSFSTIVILLFVISFFSAHVILKYTGYKEQESRKIFAQKLSAEQDPLAEHLFAELEEPVSSDTALINLLNHPNYKHKSLPAIAPTHAETFKHQLLSKYFSGYWEKYEIKISVFDTTCLPLLQSSAPDRDNLAYFESVISSEGIRTESKRLFYLKSSSGRISYLAHIPLVHPKRIADLFIEFDSRVVSDEMGFPELMLDRKIGIEQDLQDYSYAKYKDGKLISYHGKFPYSLSSESFLADSSAGKIFPRITFSDMDGYSHLSYMPNGNTLVVLSKKGEGQIEVITIFSYLFAFFSLILLLLLFLRVLIFERRIRLDSFRSRIQFVLVSMVLFSLLFFGGGTIFYINRQYDRQTQQNVRDKMISALVEARQEIGSETELKITKSDFFSYILKRMSNIFLTDITLYDKAGNLVGSSQMKMFGEGLMSRKMCPASYYRLAIKQNIEFIHDEKIGNLEYLSAYCSLRNNSGDLLGYLNIPYFARQSELEKEISTILSAIINIYVLLFVISVVLALAISEYFTKPLKLIQEKLSKLKLGKTSESIEWSSQDEIGSLVNEYNRMIDELQKSAELLARSERETAWREMAKQVAHEIKNPLTPMKLSIQHLQRTWKNKDDDMDKKIERITATIIEQIEALSTIASEFSNFAKMPVSVNEKINVRSVLENTIELFKDSTDSEITFDCKLGNAFVFADKEQMLRVCTNLLKNALQAIPENQQGKIEVSLSRKEESILLKIKDNGTGISEDKMGRIFTPNFTTKTGGMGLGLAMAKSIVETFHGKIWFETAREKGTTFFVSLPEYKL